MTQENNTPAILGPIDPNQAFALRAAPLREGTIDTSSPEGQHAAAIMAEIGATGVEGELAIVAKPTPEGGQVASHFVNTSHNDLGTSIEPILSDGTPNPILSGISSPEDAMKSAINKQAEAGVPEHKGGMRSPGEHDPVLLKQKNLDYLRGRLLDAKPEDRELYEHMIVDAESALIAAQKAGSVGSGQVPERHGISQSQS